MVPATGCPPSRTATHPRGWPPSDSALGLRPGGQDIAAQILWRHRKQVRVAYLYRLDLDKPKRAATPAQHAAIDKALTSRRTCPECRQVNAHYIPRRYGECFDCHYGRRRAA